jgi:hypothetical protein
LGHIGDLWTSREFAHNFSKNAPTIFISAAADRPRDTMTTNEPKKKKNAGMPTELPTSSSICDLLTSDRH